MLPRRRHCKRWAAAIRLQDHGLFAVLIPADSGCEPQQLVVGHTLGVVVSESVCVAYYDQVSFAEVIQVEVE
jgi:hypothetical protein